MVPAADSEADVVIVGSGFGGGVSAYALSRGGLRVVLLERGGWPLRDDEDWDAHRILIERRYRSDCPVLIDQGPGHDEEREYPNEMVGGNSVLFGAATLRLREADFTSSWPIPYAALEPCYTRAEKLFEVHGEVGEDPHEPARSAPYPFGAIALTAPAQRIFRAAQALGLRPFRLPVAINHRNPARARCCSCFTCDGFPCKIEAKNDVTTTALREAQRDCLSSATRDHLVRQARRVLRPAGGLFSRVKNFTGFSHALGSVRFGRVGRQSVLDPDCRFWALSNLFVVDGSFMPTSAGVNPSLTIAANALRVADRILEGFPHIAGGSTRTQGME